MPNDVLNNELKQYVLMRTDFPNVELKDIVGKLLVQAGHAFQWSFWESEKQNPSQAEEYKSSGSTAKVSLRCKLSDIERAEKELKELGIPYSVITDLGRTIFSEPTITCLGIGPVYKNSLPNFIQRLQLFKI